MSFGFDHLFIHLHLARATPVHVTDSAVKKAMEAILTSNSVIYAKTDFTQICNRKPIRLEAIKRLIDAKLLMHADDYWIEPNRAKKRGKKELKRLLREGWLK